MYTIIVLVLASGGAAAPPTTVPDSVVRIGGLRGCVRKVIINGIAQDLARAAPSPRQVGQCFPAVEPAAHLAGNYIIHVYITTGYSSLLGS
ncbi:unnamed protein product [Plutella xylostella]|uniref:(diamondback moth) hypothetical protein n=1 Tax=Plutella xylostella TaxID=51655 RepID=A0A8S4F1X7_PLUXY|nr:unnamed protein product [Plutella xylostella]